MNPTQTIPTLPTALLEMPIDPERPIDANFYDLNNVRWYARLSFEDRNTYLDYMIAKRKAEDEAWRVKYAKDHNEDESADFRMSRLICTKFSEAVINLSMLRRLEIEEQGPLSDWQKRSYQQPGYYCDNWNWRWKRKRHRKMVSVDRRCEYSGCTAWADHVHHLHYNNLGHETNDDLEALCARHHRARHGL